MARCSGTGGYGPTGEKFGKGYEHDAYVIDPKTDKVIKLASASDFPETDPDDGATSVWMLLVPKGEPSPSVGEVLKNGTPTTKKEVYGTPDMKRMVRALQEENPQKTIERAKEQKDDKKKSDLLVKSATYPDVPSEHDVFGANASTYATYINELILSQRAKLHPSYTGEDKYEMPPPLEFRSSPGSGKTSAAKAFLAEHGLNSLVFEGAHMTTDDIVGGLPANAPARNGYPDETELVMMTILRDDIKKLDEKGIPWVLIIEDAGKGSDTVMNQLLSIIDNGTIGGTKLENLQFVILHNNTDTTGERDDAFSSRAKIVELEISEGTITPWKYALAAKYDQIDLNPLFSWLENQQREVREQFYPRALDRLITHAVNDVPLEWAIARDEDGQQVIKDEDGINITEQALNAISELLGIQRVEQGRRSNPIKDAVRLAVRGGVPVSIWGSPGCGKTEKTKQEIEKAGYKPKVIKVTDLLPEHLFLQIPEVPKDPSGQTRLIPMAADWLSGHGIEDDTVIVLDDFDRDVDDPRVQGILLSIIHDGTVGGLPISPKIKGFILNGNGVSDYSAGTSHNTTILDPALRDRYSAFTTNEQGTGAWDYLRNRYVKPGGQEVKGRRLEGDNAKEYADTVALIIKYFERALNEDEIAARQANMSARTARRAIEEMARNYGSFQNEYRNNSMASSYIPIDEALRDAGINYQKGDTGAVAKSIKQLIDDFYGTKRPTLRDYEDQPKKVNALKEMAKKAKKWGDLPPEDMHEMFGALSSLKQVFTDASAAEVKASRGPVGEAMRAFHAIVEEATKTLDERGRELTKDQRQMAVTIERLWGDLTVGVKGEKVGEFASMFSDK